LPRDTGYNSGSARVRVFRFRRENTDIHISKKTEYSSFLFFRKTRSRVLRFFTGLSGAARHFVIAKK
jgi:hypothetical protein